MLYLRHIQVLRFGSEPLSLINHLAVPPTHQPPQNIKHKTFALGIRP